MQLDMTLPATWWHRGLFVLAVMGVLPLLAREWRHPGIRCNWDGQIVSPDYQVTIGDGRHRRVFCDVTCAGIALQLSSHLPERVEVVDEATGVPLMADSAIFVRSRIVTNRHNGNRWHVFARRKDAERHAQESRGRLFVGDDRPLVNRSGASL